MVKGRGAQQLHTDVPGKHVAEDNAQAAVVFYARFQAAAQRCRRGAVETVCVIVGSHLGAAKPNHEITRLIGHGRCGGKRSRQRRCQCRLCYNIHHVISQISV